MADARPGLRRFFQFRITTLLALTTGVAIGFAPLKLWELWQAATPQVVIQAQLVEVEQGTLANLLGESPEANNGALALNADESLLERLIAAQNSGQARIVSSPTVMTLNAQPVTVEIGAKVPVAVRAPDGAVTMTTETVGKLFEFKPTILRNQRIRLDYAVDIRSQHARAGTAEANSFVPGIDAWRVAGQTEVQAGNTILVYADHAQPIDAGSPFRQTVLLLKVQHPLANGMPLPPLPIPTRTAARPSRS